MVLRDISRYPIANQPYTYDRVSAIMKVWGYKPVGDHNIFDEELLIWEAEHSPARYGRLFVMSPPKWRAHGYDKPVWPQYAFQECAAAAVAQYRGKTVVIDGIELVAWSPDKS